MTCRHLNLITLGCDARRKRCIEVPLSDCPYSPKEAEK